MQAAESRNINLNWWLPEIVQMSIEKKCIVDKCPNEYFWTQSQWISQVTTHKSEMMTTQNHATVDTEKMHCG
jgi:hypothetical protein